LREKSAIVKAGMRTFGENLTSALRSLRGSWLRTALTMLGVVIGVGSVALLVSIGQGVKKEVTEQVQGLGANLVFIVPGKLDKNSQPNPLALLGVSTLTRQDLDALAALPGVHRVTPFMFVAGTIEHERQPFSAFVVAAAAAWADIRPRPMAEGRFFTRAEETENVCVLAHQPRAAIFGDSPALGKTVAVQGVPFRVIGILPDEQASALFGGGGFENMIFLPAGTAQKQIPHVQINRIVLQTNPGHAPEQVLGDIERTLGISHGGREDFGVLTQKQLLATLYRLMAIVTAMLTGISAISLVVAGIGIMNIMLVTVTERTREIGVRKTVGARRKDIFTQFLMEALIISSLGGVLGIAAAVGLCDVVGRMSPLHPIVTPGVIGLAFCVCLAVGVVFGTLPAMRAARLDPIAALRYE
jgi:putative ABC transport system permease protein